MNWYQAESTKTSVRQVVVEIPPGHEKDSKFGMMFFGSKYLQLMTSVWVAGFFRMDGDPGPYVLVRGDGAASQLRGSPLRIAFSFYRMRAGGLMASSLRRIRLQSNSEPKPRTSYSRCFTASTRMTPKD
jgi:hypothetical protein